MSPTAQQAEQQDPGEALKAHLGHSEPVEGCPHCAVIPMLGVIWERWRQGSEEEMNLIWDLQDGYGSPGWTPPDGEDWSGIRDSTPAAIAEIYDGLVAIRPESRLAD